MDEDGINLMTICRIGEFCCESWCPNFRSLFFVFFMIIGWIKTQNFHGCSSHIFHGRTTPTVNSVPAYHGVMSSNCFPFNHRLKQSRFKYCQAPLNWTVEFRAPKICKKKRYKYEHDWNLKEQWCHWWSNAMIQYIQWFSHSFPMVSNHHRWLEHRHAAPQVADDVLVFFGSTFLYRSWDLSYSELSNFEYFKVWLIIIIIIHSSPTWNTAILVWFPTSSLVDGFSVKRSLFGHNQRLLWDHWLRFRIGDPWLQERFDTYEVEPEHQHISIISIRNLSKQLRWLVSSSSWNIHQGFIMVSS